MKSFGDGDLFVVRKQEEEEKLDRVAIKLIGATTSVRDLDVPRTFLMAAFGEP